MELGLTKHTAVITGASKGIGLAIARGLAEGGCDLQIVSRHPEAIERAAQSIGSQFAVKVKVHALDLARAASGCASYLSGIVITVDGGHNARCGAFT